ncbi:carbohydrate ABC transporter permease [Terrabacter sp. MAHUQ-38]|uniref:carbohydrate ABC transporter permease n=1 Tax=unclassified Terrabacter TaxID=2630222 RepID=UPI001CAA6DC9|nr:carbohydrate ABC transporter permease [Terrabacter sp. MAHUQ-38]
MTDTMANSLKQAKTLRDPTIDPVTVRQSRPGQDEGDRRERSRRHRPSRVVFTILLVVSLLLLFPVYWIFVTALKSPNQLASGGTLLWPAPAHFENFIHAVTDIAFLVYAANSVFLSTVSGLLTTLSSALVGYGFARLRGPGKNVLFGVLIAMMMMPGIITLIPTYLLFARVGLVGTYWPWVLWGAAAAPYLIFLYRQFFAGLPKELEEAAVLDGCSQARIFWQIFLPLSKPVLVTAFVMSFAGVWGDFISPMLLLDNSNTTLAVALTNGYVNEKGFPLNNLIAAGAILYVIPLVLIFVFIQRRYVQGLSATGIK